MTAESIVELARSPDADIRQRAAVQVSQSAETRNLPLMLEMLGDRDWRVRKTILEGFVRTPTDEVIGALLQALYDPENAGKRNSATEALVRIGARAIPFVLEELRTNGDLDVRLSLVNLLGDLRSDAGFDALLGLVGTEADVNVLSAAASSIGKYRQARAIPTLLRLIERDDLWLKFHVVEALGEIGDRSALPAILPLYREKSLRKPILEAIGKIGDVGTVTFLLRIIADEEKLNLTALRALVRVAEADKPRVVETAERHLIQRKFRESFPGSKIEPLLEHLRVTPKRDVKNFILKFLGWSGNQTVLPAILGYLQQPDSADVAAQALIDFGPAAAPLVLEALRSADDDDATALLLRVVNVISGPEAVPTIIQFLDHENPAIRRLAIETFGEILDPATIDYLLAKIDDPDVACQQAAVNSISALVAAFPETKNDTLARIRRLLSSPSVPAKLNSLSIYVNIQGEGYPDELLLAWNDGDPVIRQKAISLMGRFGEERFADQIVLSLADEAIAVRIAAIQAMVQIRPDKGLEPLIAALEDHDIWIRTAAAQALGEYRHPSAVAPLVQHLRSDVPPVRIAAIEALGKSARSDVAAVLFECLEEPDAEVRRAALHALGAIPGEDVFDRLIAAVQSEDWRLRAAAAAALGARGDRRALDPLHQILLADPDPYVQQSAVAALDRIGDVSSFPFLLQALENAAILDDVTELFIRHKKTYRPLLEEAWRTADSRREVVIAAILQAMKDAGA